MAINEQEEAVFSVFPNPVQAGALLTINLSEHLSMPENVEVLSATGEVLSTIRQNRMEEATVFNISIPVTVSPGIYFIQLNSANWIEPFRKMIMVK